MSILRRSAPKAEAKSKEPVAEPAKSRRVKITVERETVTMLVRGQPEEIETKPIGETSAPESGRRELSPPATATPATDCE